MSIIEFLSSEFKVSQNLLRKFIATCPYRYKVYPIPKRNGKGERIIAQPTKQLKIIQKMVLDNFFGDLPIHDCATAYMKGIGIKENASKHVMNPYLLKMDYINFFPSISSSDFSVHINKYSSHQFNQDELNLLENIFFYRQKRGGEKILSIGAPSSPFLSNTIMYDIDCEIDKICQTKSITYTRYADDLAFSTKIKNILFELSNEINQILQKAQYPKLSINEGKTVFASPATNRHLTGLTITNDKKISIGRSKKRHIRSLVFKYCNGVLEAEKKDYLKGYLAFCKSVEPSFVTKLRKKYGEKVLELI